MSYLTTTPARRRGGMRAMMLCGLLLLAVLASGVWQWNARRHPDDAAILHQVRRDDFVLTVTERGEVQAAGVTPIRSRVKNKNTTGLAILRIVPEGTVVQAGDFLVELDSSSLEEQRTTQQINVHAVEALVIEAKNVYETAVIAKREYLEGTYLEQRQTIESEVFVAEENLNRAREYYQYSQKLAVKGYVNQLQLEADQFAVEKSAKELAAARTKLKVLDEFTKLKTLKELESNILIAEAKWQANQNSLRLEQEKLGEIDEQIALCTMVSPRAGIVRYAHERDRHGNNDFIVEEGAVVRERQEIIHLPDPGAIEVEVEINESLIQFVAPGLPARVAPIGLGELVLPGQVARVNPYAEPAGWRKANVKEYRAYVTIENPPPEMRSGMTASVTITCLEVHNAMQVPVQAVYADDGQHFCLVRHAGRWQARQVQCGPTNDKFYVIQQGLQVGDRVALNPRRYVSK